MRNEFCINLVLLQTKYYKSCGSLFFFEYVGHHSYFIDQYPLATFFRVLLIPVVIFTIIRLVIFQSFILSFIVMNAWHYREVNINRFYACPPNKPLLTAAPWHLRLSQWSSLTIMPSSLVSHHHLSLLSLSIPWLSLGSVTKHHRRTLRSGSLLPEALGNLGVSVAFYL